ncbi:hypothetical protein [Actinoplanes sp. TFC3]|uniref:hypothetical protein n=1 Tax=Actinoplanes sp. TFC3 TaxID=1710355 RepID=UPI0008343787|nr:hypothetical protein [Actinoplanes sp. TFC3]
MPDSSAEQQVPRAVWRRTASGPAVAGSDEPLRCGGPELSTEERFQLMRERRRARQAAEAAAKEEEAPSKRVSKVEDEEDEDKAAERFRNDRYAVKLLHQDNSVWGGNDSGSGMLG